MTKGSTDDGVLYHAGFPNAAEDNLASLSLDRLLVKRPRSTFYWRLDEPVEALGWSAGSLLVVDRSLVPSAGRLVVVVDETAFRIARFQDGGLAVLGGDDLSDQASVWGVVTHCIEEV